MNRVHLAPRTLLRSGLVLRSVVGHKILSSRRLLSTAGKIIYTSPAEKPVRLLKLFCVSGTAVTFAAAPLLMLIDSSLPMVARVTALAFATFGTGSTTVFVARYFSGYVSSIYKDADTGDLVFSTSTLFLRPRLTTVYDKSFLVPSDRPGAKFALAEHVNGTGADGAEETIAQTTDADGRVLGRWIVRWDKGIGRCRAAGNVVRCACFSPRCGITNFAPEQRLPAARGDAQRANYWDEMTGYSSGGAGPALALGRSKNTMHIPRTLDLRLSRCLKDRALNKLKV